MFRWPTLGGRISVIYTIIWTGCGAVLFWGFQDLPEAVILSCWLVLVTLSFPLGLLTEGIYYGGGDSSHSGVWIGFLLMIPNLFLWGYGTAAIWRVGVWLFTPTDIERALRTENGPGSGTEKVQVEHGDAGNPASR